MRILHEGHSALRIVDDEERVLLVDPYESKDAFTDARGARAHAVLLSGGPWVERYRGVVEMAKARRRPRVVASRPVLDWVATQGGIEAVEADCEVTGTFVEALPYEIAEPERGTRDKLRAALTSPKFAAERFRGRRGLPETQPFAWRWKIPNNHLVVHLGLSLHDHTSAAWLEQCRVWCEGATAVVAGYPIGQSEAFIAHIMALKPRRVLIMDQTNDLRRDAGLPAEIITPVRDTLVARGVEAHPLVSGVSLRFDKDDTIKRW
jgi:L-ascorbate metabolism protein UlaG (beta-lactamase superfamily)